MISYLQILTSQTIPYPATHTACTYIAHIWEYPHPPILGGSIPLPFCTVNDVSLHDCCQTLLKNLFKTLTHHHSQVVHGEYLQNALTTDTCLYSALQYFRKIETKSGILEPLTGGKLVKIINNIDTVHHWLFRLPNKMKNSSWYQEFEILKVTWNHIKFLRSRFTSVKLRHFHRNTVRVLL